MLFASFGTTSLTRIFRRSRFVFKDANRDTIESLRQHPLVGAHYHLSSPQLQNLRSWPVAGFEAIRIYYLLDGDTIRVIRVLHGKRDLKRILERERTV